MSTDPKTTDVLLALVQKLSQPAPLEEALVAVTDAALELLPADHASIRLVDASRMQLIASARSGKGRRRPAMSLGKGEGIAGWVLEHGEPARADDVSMDPRFVVAVGQGFDIGAILAEPLVSNGSVVGVLSVSSAIVGAFTKEDELLARVLARCSVPVIEHARQERLAVSCELTRALDARELLPQLRAEMERWHVDGMSLSLLVLDLDGLEHVNKAYGRAMGDRVLRIVADRIRAHTRVFDILIRSEGDEFALVMAGPDPAQARAAAERLRTRVSDEPMEPLQGGFVSQAVSVGGATWDGRESAEELYERARAALRAAKARGGNRVDVPAP